jgi:hypothetical protein
MDEPFIHQNDSEASLFLNHCFASDPCRTVLSHIESGRQRSLTSRDYFPPPNIGFKLRSICAHLGIRSISAIGEADKFVGYYTRQSGAFGVLCDDSDFFAMPVNRYLSIKTLDYSGEYPVVTCFHRARVVAALNYEGIEEFIPLAASLVGQVFCFL